MSITVYIDGARDLPAADPNFPGNKKDSDSYVEIIVGKKKAKTKVVPDNKNPVWRERFTFPITDANEIVFRVFDDDWNTDDLLGEAKLRIADLKLEQGPVDRTLKLVPAEPFKKLKPGELRVRIEEDRGGAGGRPPRPGPPGGKPSPPRPPRRYSDEYDYGRRPGRPGRYEEDRYGYDSDYGRYGDRYGDRYSDKYGDRYGDRYGYERDNGRRYYDDASVYYGGGSRIYDQQPSRYYEPSSYVASPRYTEYAPSYGGRVVSSGTRYPSSTYLDAADGVIDGRYFGSRIISAPTTTYAPATSYAPVTSYAPATSYAPVTSYAPTTSYAPRVINSEPFTTRVVGPSSITRTQVLDDGYYGGRVVSRGAPLTTSVVPRASSAAYALDSADGVIDGRYFGSRIISGGDRVVNRAYPTATSAVAYDSPDGYYGSRIVSGGDRIVTRGVPNAATVLDSADGVLDGRYFGSRIMSGGDRVVTRAVSNAATALDSADGVLDGRYFGSRIVSGTRTVPSASVVSPSRVVSSGTTYARPAGSYVTSSAPLGSTALAVDAADGVLDGRYYGSRIVQASPTRAA